MTTYQQLVLKGLLVIIALIIFTIKVPNIKSSIYIKLIKSVDTYGNACCKLMGEE